MSSKEEFESWLLTEAKKSNSKALSDAVYEDIVSYLKNGSEETHFRKFRERVKRNKYCLMNYARFSLYDVLCLPLSEVCNFAFGAKIFSQLANLKKYLYIYS